MCGSLLLEGSPKAIVLNAKLNLLFKAIAKYQKAIALIFIMILLFFSFRKY